MPFTLFVIGNIASGKSTACSYLARSGARHLDLDVIAKSLYDPGSAIVDSIAEAFGWDVLDESGEVRSSVLAQRAFVDEGSVHQLNEIVHPVLLDYLSNILLPVPCCSLVVPTPALTVVEISAPASFTDAFGLADEVIAITAPLDTRRARAIERGMSGSDFDARSDLQPSEDELKMMADTVIDNSVADDTLFGSLDLWLEDRGIRLADGK